MYISHTYFYQIYFFESASHVLRLIFSGQLLCLRNNWKRILHLYSKSVVFGNIFYRKDTKQFKWSNYFYSYYLNYHRYLVLFICIGHLVKKSLNVMIQNISRRGEFFFGKNTTIFAKTMFEDSEIDISCMHLRYRVVTKYYLNLI